jgi:hypothetical protein
MKLHALLLAAALTIAACGTTQRALSYNNSYPDADVFVDNQRFQLWLLAQNATVYARDTTLGPFWWGAAANAVLTQIGCYGVEVSEEERSQLREVSYTCPEPVDVATQGEQRRAEWRRGVRVSAPVQ